MSLNYLLLNTQQLLVQSFHNAIVHGMNSTWMRCTKLGTKPQEPDFVAGLVLDSIPSICKSLNNALSQHGFSVSVSSVFCHQTPKVNFSHNFPSGKCELGDILFVHIHRPQKGPVRRNALLFQAKKSSKQPYLIPTREQHQLYLYENWPDFVYHRSGGLTGKNRSVFPKSLHSGAQYLLIDDRNPKDPLSSLTHAAGTYPMGCCLPTVNLF
jgi:hypothetical protein